MLERYSNIQVFCLNGSFEQVNVDLTGLSKSWLLSELVYNYKKFCFIPEVQKESDEVETICCVSV